MTQEDFLSVVKVMRLKNKQIFPLPVLLPITYKEKKYLKVHSKVFLEYKNYRVAEIFIKSIFTIDFEKDSIFNYISIKWDLSKIIIPFR